MPIPFKTIQYNRGRWVGGRARSGAQGCVGYIEFYMGLMLHEIDGLFRNVVAYEPYCIKKIVC